MNPNSALAPNTASSPPAKAAPLSAGGRLLLFLLIACVYAAHQDTWNWAKADPMIFGFLPAGLAYHAAYSIAVSALMAILVKLAWPRKLEDIQGPSE